MTDTIWREKSPRQSMRVDSVNVSEELGCGGGALLLTPKGRPDWVRDPHGDKAKVLAIITITEPYACRKCGEEQIPVGSEVMVAEMPSDSTQQWFIYVCRTEECFVWESRSVLSDHAANPP